MSLSSLTYTSSTLQNDGSVYCIGCTFGVAIDSEWVVALPPFSPAEMIVDADPRKQRIESDCYHHFKRKNSRCVVS